MKLYEYINEICDVSSANTGVMVDAIDMFLNNVEDYGREDDQYHYSGADYCDYAALAPYAKQLRDDGAVLKEAVDNIDVELQKLHKAGKHDEAIALAKREYERVEAEQEAEGVDEEAK